MSSFHRPLLRDLRGCTLLRCMGALLVLACTSAAAQTQTAGWPVTEGAPGGGRYSPLTDINTTNVSQLEQAWVYRYGKEDYFDGRPPYGRGTSSETTPILVDQRLIFTTPTNRVIALDPESGRELWKFDPGLDRNRWYSNMWTNRGVSAWQGRPGDACSPRVFLTTLDARLIALDARTGRRCPGFADVNLREGVQPMFDPAFFSLTSPGTVVGDVVVVGSSSADFIAPEMPHGVVRAFDVRSGQLRWSFRTIPAKGEPGFETWGGDTTHTGAANVWSTITADEQRGLVFLPVSSASPDHYGGTRPGMNLYSDSVVALDVRTGQLKWSFQTVHHDLWDYDLAVPPILIDIRRDGREVPAVMVLTKTSLVFVLHRETGVTLFPWRSVRFRPATCQTSRRGPRSPFRSGRRRSPRIASRRPTSTRRIARPVPRGCRSCATRVSTHHRACRGRWCTQLPAVAPIGQAPRSIPCGACFSCRSTMLPSKCGSLPQVRTPGSAIASKVGNSCSRTRARPAIARLGASSLPSMSTRARSRGGCRRALDRETTAIRALVRHWQ